MSPLLICWLLDPVPLCYFFGKQIHFLKCCIFGKSNQILVTQFLIFESYLHCVGKCMAKLYATYIAEAWQSLQKKIGLWTVNSLPIQSFKFIHFVSSGTMLALLWLFLVLMGGKADGQDFFWQKQLVSNFFCSITCFWVHDSEYKHLIPWYWIELVILFCSFTTKNRLMTKKSNKCHSIP